ncbi:hypothetical protein SASPL_130373 [Salvia splendens]|uniref:25S rRNA (uridine-N(3))-methyltransferase BMT5-like domain-containing protein n=1 Tax=Salvia splendens TaxID=180675 RepID=A0A8X8ZKK9_SALSN|nr:uncharacterized protein At4g26485-like [Salvia splendens]KAG6407384.1 hypothetical protein SASPL_130373 [Salvia splendens]
MGNLQSICGSTISLGCESKTRDEEGGGNQYKSNEALVSLSSIYKATKAILQKLYKCVYLRPRKVANPSLPIQNPPQVCSSSHSILEDICLSSSTGSSDDEENVSHVCQIYSADGNEEVEQEHVVSVIGVEIGPCLHEREAKEQVKTIIVVEEEEREAKEQVNSSSIIVGEEEKRIKHYSSRHSILLVGEGDFSFSACLALAFGSAANIVATSLDSLAFLKKNYGNAMSNIGELRRRGGKVMHEIDATKMANHELLGHLKFDRVIYNFPYAGIFPKIVPRETQLSLHRELVSKFLMNARNMISENGEIHISHKTNGFHDRFYVEDIASSHGLRLIEAVTFERADYPGYNTKSGFGGDANFDCYPSNTFKYGLN